MFDFEFANLFMVMNLQNPYQTIIHFVLKAL